MSIDETSLSASPQERRNSLEKHLQSRPDPQDLKNRHILLQTNVAPYVTFSASFPHDLLCRSPPALPLKLNPATEPSNLPSKNSSANASLTT